MPIQIQSVQKKLMFAVLSFFSYLRKIWKSAIFGILIFTLGYSVTFAEKADRLQPIKLEADQAFYDDLKQVYHLQGKVILSKGSILIKTEQAVINVSPEGYQRANASGGDKGLAFMRQKREGLNEFFEGYAEKIDYDSQTDKIILTGKARLVRLEGKSNQTLDEITSHQMVYDGQNETYQAMQGQTNGRVRAIIAPKIKN